MKHILFLAATSAACIFAACSGAGKPLGKAPKSDSAHLIDTAVVTTGTISDTETFTAAIEGQTRNNINPQVPGRITTLSVKVGDRVLRNQVLAEMDRTNLVQGKIELDNRKLDYDRASELYGVGGISKAQWEQAQTAYNIAKTRYANIAENTVLRSPVSGVVTARNYDPGDLSSPAQPIYVVESLNPVKLKLNISEQYIERIHSGMAVEVSVDALEGRTFQGAVSLIYPTVNPQSHTFITEIELQNKEQEVRPGMYARCTVNFGTRSGIMVADQAVIKQMGSGERYVYLVKGGKAVRTVVTIGRQKENFIEIKHGLRAGDAVITAGAASVSDGQAVKINSKQTAQ